MRAAVKNGHDDIVTFLAAKKINLNSKDGRGLTALHLAAFHRKFSVYEKLLFFGADKTILDPDGRTAEEILKMKCAKVYHDRCFLFRLFSSPLPPPLLLKPLNMQNLINKVLA